MIHLRDWAGLDQDLLQLIMHHTQLSSRLLCALVCGSWQQAAAAAPQHVTACDLPDTSLSGLHLWLQKHRQTVTSLELQQQPGQQLAYLPCSKLRELVVTGGEVQLAGGPSQPPLLQQAAASLTKLDLSNMQHAWSHAVPLSTLTNLCHLHPDGSTAAAQYHFLAGTIPPTIELQHLMSLTSLALARCVDVSACNAGISLLTNLENLKLRDWCYSNPYEPLSLAGWEHLQQLTALQLQDFGYMDSQHNSSLLCLTTLQELQLHNCGPVDAAHLLGLSQLRSCKMQGVRFTSVMDTPAFLAQQQQLTLLKMEAVPDDWQGILVSNLSVEESYVARMRMTAAQLTASRYLQHLDLSNFNMPQQAWQHAFPAGSLLPELTCLVAPNTLHDISHDSDDGGLLQGADIEALAQCCPALLNLSAGHVLPIMSALSHLQHLTWLKAIWPRETATAAVTVLAALSGLQHLELCRPARAWYPGASILAAEHVLLPLCQQSRLTSLSLHSGYNPPVHLNSSGAEALARLTGLVELDVTGCSVSDAQLLHVATSLQLSCLKLASRNISVRLSVEVELAGKHTSDGNLMIQASKPTSRDVGLQLLRCCANTYQAVEPQAHDLMTELAQQQQTSAMYNVQLLDHQARLQAQEATNACLQQQLAAKDVALAQLQLDLAKMQQQALGRP